MRRDAGKGACLAVALGLACGGDRGPDADSAPAPAPPPSARATLSVDAGKYGYEPNASIFDKPAEMWTAQSDRAAGQYLNLAVWKLKSGEPVQFNLAVESGGADLREISTVAGGTTKGSGTATVTRQGEGGSIVIDGTDASGSALRVTVTCARFEPIAEEGGR